MPAKLLPPDHPQRALLAAEVLARVPEPLFAPCRATYVAVRIDAEALDAELAHIAALCASCLLYTSRCVYETGITWAM